MGAFSLWHWVVVLFVAVVIFGPKRLSGLGKDLGEGIRGLRDGLRDEGESAEAKRESPGGKDHGAG